MNGVFILRKNFKKFPNSILYVIKYTGTTKIAAEVLMKDEGDHNEIGATNIPVDNCIGPGCSIHEIEYSHATMRQLNALATISSQCQQYFRVLIQYF